MASESTDSSSDDFNFQDSWETELELALLESDDLSKIRDICQLRPIPAKLRKDLWKLCLQFDKNVTSMSTFTETFDLPSQELLHNSCMQAAASIIAELSGIDSNTSVDDYDYQFMNQIPSTSQLCSDIESVLTHFSKTFMLSSLPTDDFVSILATLYSVLQPVGRNELFAHFTSLVTRFIPSYSHGITRACTALHLLLQYHEPELCSFLDSHKLGPELYAKPWFENLFLGHVMKDTLFALWDICFLLNESHFGMLVTLVLLLNAKKELMLLGKREDLLAKLQSLAQPMKISDIEHLVPLTQIYAEMTPTSFRAAYLPLLFGTSNSNVDDHLLTGALSLVVSVDEILDASSYSEHQNEPSSDGADEQAFPSHSSSPSVRFLLVDCRPADQYNAGHLSTAFYLDTEVMLSNPPEFNTIVQALLQSQQRGIASGSKAAGEHIAFLGSGRLAEDRLANMVVAHFLRLNTRYISLVNGGYAALHEALSNTDFDRRIVSHEPDICFVCAGKEGLRMTKLAQKSRHSAIPCGASLPDSHPLPTFSDSASIFSKLTSLLKKSGSARQSPSSETISSRLETFSTKNLLSSPILSQTDLNSKVSYRNTAAVFSIDDNDDYDIVDSELPFNPSLWKHPIPVFAEEKNVKESVVLHFEHCALGEQVDFTDCRFRPEVLSAFDCKIFNALGQLSDTGVILLLVRHFILVQEKRNLFTDTISSFGSLMKWQSKSPFQSIAKRNRGNETRPPKNVTETQRKNGFIAESIPLSSMVRITSNKRVPEVITFHYHGSEDLISESLNSVRLFIPKAGDAVKEIKLAVFRVNNVENDGAL